MLVVLNFQNRGKFVTKQSINRTALVAQTVKNLPTMQETWVRSLGWEDPLEMGMATHSNILAGESPWTKEPGGTQSMLSQSQTRLRD